MYKFKLPIGDWSDDGHGKCTWYIIDSNKPFKDVEAAYEAAAKKLKNVNPENICSDYEDNQIEESVWNELKTLGFNPFKTVKELKQFEKDGRNIAYDTELMAKLVLRFIKEGNPAIELKIVSDKEMPMLSNGFGYGLFE